MAATANPVPSSPKSSASWLWAPQSVTIASVLGGILTGGIWVGHIQTKLDEHTETLKTISSNLSDPQQGISVHLARAEEKLNNLNDKIDKLSPKVVRKDFEQELDRLNARIDSLQNQVGALTRDLENARAEINRQDRENAQLRRTSGEVDSQLSEIASDLRSLSGSASSAETRLPEGYRDYLLGRLNALQQRLQELRSRLKG
jgi:chromosome segregation ATPase